MPELFGRSMSKQELLSHVGDIRQVAGVRSVELDDGPERGVRAAEVRTGSGLRFLVVFDRGMDIADACWGATPLAWLSPTGVAHPAFFEQPGIGWLRGFHGGLVATCGMSNVGPPAEDAGESFGLHGRASYLPARNVGVVEEWRGEEYVIELSGTLREARVFGENLELRRTLSTSLGSRSIAIRDRVTNLCAEPTPLMLLYHVNLGWPLLDADAEILAARCADEPRDEQAADGKERARVFEAPTPGYKEKVYLRDLPADADGMARIALANRTLSPPLAVVVSYEKEKLPIVVQWKMMGRGTYVCGLEPSTCRVAGRAAARAAGTLSVLGPGETRDFAVQLDVLTSAAEIEAFAASRPTGTE
jgi:hypothetical protein